MLRVKVTEEGVFINGKRATRLQTDGSRECFVSGNVIVKLNDSEMFYQSNAELRKWKVIEPRDKQYFVPPISGKIARKNGWIAQRIIKFKCGRRKYASHQVIKAIARKYNLKDFESMENKNGTLLPCNWGILPTGQPVIFDWGY